jgi:hypothetical protein
LSSTPSVGLILRIIGLVSHNGLVGSIVQNGLVDGNDLVNKNGLVDRNDLVNHNGFIDLGVSITGGFVGFVGLGLGLVSLGGLISNIRLAGFVSFVGLVLVGFIGLGLVNQLIGLIGLISLGLVDIISLIGSSASFAHRLISLIGLIGLIGLGDLCITSLVGLLASSAHQLIGLISFVIAAKQYHGGSSKQQHSELPRCNQVLPTFQSMGRLWRREQGIFSTKPMAYIDVDEKDIN